MAYLAPSEFVTKMVDAGESKIFMSTRDTVIRAYMAGAILALAAWFAVTINVNTGQPLVGALLFPVGFCMLYLLGFDLLTGVFVLSPLALLDKRPGVTLGGVLRNWGLVFIGNFAGALTVAFMMAFVTTFGFTQEPDKVGMTIGNVGEARTLGYAAHGAAGMATLFIRGMLCNWMVSTGVVGAMISTTVPGKVIAMWMPIMVFFYMVFEHSVVNMFLFPSGLMLGSQVLDHGLPDLERDPDRARQPRRRPRLHRPHALRDACEDRAEARESPRGLISGAASTASCQGGARPALATVDAARADDLGRAVFGQGPQGNQPGFPRRADPRRAAARPEGHRVALADGISSSDVSRIASEFAVKSFLTDYYCTSDSWSVKTSAQRVIAATNSWLHAQTRRSRPRYDKDKGYVCTLSALVLKSTTAHLFHVGDTPHLPRRGQRARAIDRGPPRRASRRSRPISAARSA